MTKLICVTGIDGSGKSTLVSELNRRLPGSVIANIWQSMDADQSLFKTKEEVYRYMFSLTPNSRLMFLVHAMQYGLEKARESGAEIIIIDGFFYKYFGPELVLGADLKLVQGLVSVLPAADLVFCLELTPEASFERKGEVTAYECGFVKPSRENYISFQQKVLDKRSAFDTSGWIFMDSNQGSDVICKLALDHLEKINPQGI